KWAIHLGDDRTQFIARLTVAIEQMVIAMTAAKPETLSNSREYLESLGILEKSAPSSVVLSMPPSTSQKQQGCLNWLASKICFWRSSPATETSPTSEKGKAPGEETPLLPSTVK
ncbi:MAG: hypothetical protein WBE18_08915, partial [Gammaproteobacteria bacterium]